MLDRSASRSVITATQRRDYNDDVAEVSREALPWWGEFAKPAFPPGAVGNHALP